MTQGRESSKESRLPNNFLDTLNCEAVYGLDKTIQVVGEMESWGTYGGELEVEINSMGRYGGNCRRMRSIGWIGVSWLRAYVL